jgi:DNA-binding IclR family transcriptional regulator
MDGRPTPQQTYRMRVLAVVQASPSPLTGREIASACGLTYKQAIDALNALHNHGKVNRQGRKFTARWTRVQQPLPVSQRHHLDLVMFLIVNPQTT